MNENCISKGNSLNMKLLFDDSHYIQSSLIDTEEIISKKRKKLNLSNEENEVKNLKKKKDSHSVKEKQKFKKIKKNKNNSDIS